MADAVSILSGVHVVLKGKILSIVYGFVQIIMKLEIINYKDCHHEH